MPIKTVEINGQLYAPVPDSLDAGLTRCHVVKAAGEQRYTLGLSYPANRPDVARARDGHRDFASPEALEKCAWEYMTRYREIGLFHKAGSQAEGHAEVVESYIWRAPDWTIVSPMDGSEVVIKAGDWLLGTVWDAEGWDLVRKGLIRGFSPQGGARRNLNPSPERLAQLREE